MSLDEVSVIAPATLSNMGPGFDVFGLALKEPYDVITARKLPQLGVKIEKIEGKGGESISKDASQNSAGKAAMAVLQRADANFGISLSIEKGIRPCSGIGSSGASAAGGAFAANLLLERPLPPQEVVLCAASAEPGGHADNVSPSVLGGFTIVQSYDPLEVISLKPPANLGVAVSMPDFLVSTKEARKVLPEKVDLKSMVYQVGNAAALVAGMLQGDVPLVGRSIRDKVIEPARAPLVPHLLEAERAAKEKGAVGTFLGGSGPCIIAIFDLSQMDGKEICTAVKQTYEKKGIACDSWITTWGPGCRRLL